MNEKTLFEKICDGEIETDFIFEDDQCVCFKDRSPQAPHHYLLIPRKAIPRLAAATADDRNLLGHLLLVVGKVADQEGLSAKGFRLVINNGPDGGETIPHLHLHILGGRQLEWPPG